MEEVQPAIMYHLPGVLMARSDGFDPIPSSPYELTWDHCQSKEGGTPRVTHTTSLVPLATKQALMYKKYTSSKPKYIQNSTDLMPILQSPPNSHLPTSLFDTGASVNMVNMQGCRA